MWPLPAGVGKGSDPLYETESKQIRCLNAISMSCCAYNQRTVLIVCAKFWQVRTKLKLCLWTNSLINFNFTDLRCWRFFGAMLGISSQRRAVVGWRISDSWQSSDVVRRRSWLHVQAAHKVSSVYCYWVNYWRNHSHKSAIAPLDPCGRFELYLEHNLRVWCSLNLLVSMASIDLVFASPRNPRNYVSELHFPVQLDIFWV